MDRETEIKELKEKLVSIDNVIRGELVKISTIKTEITKGYRRHDKGRYVKERNEVLGTLEKLKTEQEKIKRRLSELEGAV